MFDSTLSSVIAVNTDTETIHFYSMANGDRNAIRHDTESYRARPFDEEFFAKFQDIVKRYLERTPQFQGQKIAVVLPDTTFVTDTVNIPVIKKRAMNNSLGLAIGSIYKNHEEIEFNSFPLVQNKQFATYNILGLRKDLIAKMNNACDLNQLSVEVVTYAANSAVNGAIVLNPKLKNASFVLLDIKDNFSRFSFVVKGRTVGYYSLPFGYSALYKTRVVSEDLLFDHSPCDLLVINAKEKAKSKQLTMAADDGSVDTAETYDEADGAEDEYQDERSFTVDDTNTPMYENRTTVLPKKTARKLPKFMLRQTPDTKEGFVCENFRVFVKWTLDLLRGNQAIFALGAPEAIYVNMPDEFSFVYDTVNAELADNKVAFAPLATAAGGNEAVLKDLELFGALYAKQYNKLNNFN